MSEETEEPSPETFKSKAPQSESVEKKPKKSKKKKKKKKEKKDSYRKESSVTVAEPSEAEREIDGELHNNENNPNKDNLTTDSKPLSWELQPMATSVSARSRSDINFVDLSFFYY